MGQGKYQKEVGMDYDSYKLETPEEEDERINGASRRRMARQEYLVTTLTNCWS